VCDGVLLPVRPEASPGSGFYCSIDVLENGIRFRGIAVNLETAAAGNSFTVIRPSLRTPPYLTLPTGLGEGYARDNHAALPRGCSRSAGLGDQEYMIGIGVEKDLGSISRSDLAKVIVDAVPVIDKHLGCVPADSK
jgi:hypothetical protein